MAAVSDDPGKPLSVTAVELDHVRPDEVLVRLEATGVCHTDALVHRRVLPRHGPAVLGHEGAGVVEEVGREVIAVSPGDHVVLSFASCGLCGNCRSGHPAYCVDKFALNFSGARTDGSSALSLDGRPIGSHFFGQSSLATFANVSARSVVKVRRDISLSLLAPLGCGIQTGAGAVLRVMQVRPGSTVALFGVGAVGGAALLAARVAGCERVIAVDRSEERLQRATALGVDHTVNTGHGDPGVALMDLTAGRGVDYVLDTTGSAEMFASITASLAIRGAVCLVGAAAPDATASFRLAAGLSRGLTIYNCIEGDSIPQEFIPELIELYAEGSFPFDTLLSTYDFADVNRAFEDSDAAKTMKPVLCFPC